MITFILSIIALILGYFMYGKIVENIFAISKTRKVPAYIQTDGVDFVPMNWFKIFLIQFLNIAGLGPIFGAVMGAVFGPSAFLWIVFGSIFGGAVHDYLSGMISIRNHGISLPAITGRYLGRTIRQIMSIFTVFMMIMVGAVFVSGPANLLVMLTNGGLSYAVWASLIFIYYILATLFPVDKIIGKIYPIFGFSLLFMAIGVLIALFINGAPIPEITLDSLHNMHPKGDNYPIFPMMFVSIACGAVSGFHATQSPMMARCLKNEQYGRRVFYGAMIVEGLVALIWAAAAMSFFGSVGGLQTFLAEHNNQAAIVVDKITHSWLGTFGSILALIGVVAAPITSGDTAFRSARLIVADFFRYNQKSIRNRLFISIPLFIIGFLILQINFDIIWRYFAWSNQTLAAVTFWTITVYLAVHKRFYWITLIPGIFMTAVVSVYILIAPEGLGMNPKAAYLIGATICLTCTFVFFLFCKKMTN